MSVGLWDATRKIPSTSLREDYGVLGISNLRGINTIETNDTDNTHSHKYKASTVGGALCARYFESGKR